MKINSKNKDTIEKLHLLTGESKDTIRRFFEALVFLVTMDYMEGDTTNLPFFGDINIRHVGDTNVKGGKRAQLELDFEPEESLQRNIGQVIDGEMSEIEQVYVGRIRNSLSQLINE